MDFLQLHQGKKNCLHGGDAHFNMVVMEPIKIVVGLMSAKDHIFFAQLEFNLFG